MRMVTDSDETDFPKKCHNSECKALAEENELLYEAIKIRDKEIKQIRILLQTYKQHYPLHKAHLDPTDTLASNHTASFTTTAQKA
jgi:hypothetical protein